MKHLLFSLAALCLSLFTASAADNTLRDNVIGMIKKVNNYWQSNNKPETSSLWHWAAYHTGNMEAYRLTGEKA